MPKRVIGKHKAFLKAFALCGDITKAARTVKMDRSCHYDWLEKRPGYREEFGQATAQWADFLEGKLARRAEEGVFEPNVYQGEFVYPVKGYEKDPETGLDRVNPLTLERIPIYGKKPLGVVKYDNNLAYKMLAALKPDRYRERTEVTGKDGGPIESKLEIVFIKSPGAKENES